MPFEIDFLKDLQIFLTKDEHSLKLENLAIEVGLSLIDYLKP